MPRQPFSRVLKLPVDKNKDLFSKEWHCPCCCHGWHVQGKPRDKKMLILNSKEQYFCSEKCYNYYTSGFEVKGNLLYNSEGEPLD